ncbi:MAG: PASTA domain-containing protein [Acetobacteraceae bacterium]|nr:PASTA domain-containing protein [Acetobacteraceae bacterium]
MAPVGAGLRRRIFPLLLVTLAAVALLVVRVAWIQLVHGEELRRRALDTRLRDIPVQPRRGTIYDRQGRELAISVNVDSVYALPPEVGDRKAVAQALSQALGMDPREVEDRLAERTAFVWIKRKVSDGEAEAVRRLDLPGVGLTQESQRFYPKGTLACHLLGFAGIDSQGLEGVEVSYDRELRGTPGRIVVEYDARGHELPQAVHHYEPPQPGLDLVLTIDEVLQFVAERELDKAMAATGAMRGVVVAMDPKTGRVLAMAGRPAYDPNVYDRYPPSTWRNPAISDAFPAGSTFKPITAACALEEGVITWGDHFSCGGAIQVPGAVIHCVGGHGSLSLAGIITYSCNVGFVRVGLKIRPDRFYRYMGVFNLLEPTGIDLPGEAAGIFPPLEDVRPVDMACMAFGQTLCVTPLQLLNALTSLVNGGWLMVPQVAQELRDESGRVVKTFPPKKLRQVVSAETASELVEAMVQVVETGTGRRAQLRDYQVAGKTGTAQKVVGGQVVSGRYLGYFFGFAPAEDPRISVLVMLEEPKGSYYGGVVAAPVAAALLEDGLRYLDAPPRPAASRPPAPAAPAQAVVPCLLNLGVEEAMGLLHTAGLEGRVEGEGDQVARQVPPPGAQVPAGTVVVAYLAPEGSPVNLAAQEVTVPDLRGRTRREAAEVLGMVGLRALLEGMGRAVSQSPPPGTRLRAGSVVTVRFQQGG